MFSEIFRDCENLSLNNIELIYDIDKNIEIRNTFYNNKTTELNINFENDNFFYNDENFEGNDFYDLLNNSNIKKIKYKNKILENPQKNDKLFYFFKNPDLYNQQREKYQNTDDKEQLKSIKNTINQNPEPIHTPIYQDPAPTHIDQNEKEKLKCCYIFIKCCCCCSNNRN